MASKISVHITSGPRNGYGPFLERTKDVPLSCVVLVDQFGAALDAKEHNPAIVTIGRSQKSIDGIDPAGMDRWVETGVTPIDAATRYYEAYKGIWTGNPQIDIWITWNEWSAHWAWQSDFNMALAELTLSKGHPWKWGFLGWASGKPDGITEGDFRQVDAVLPCLQYAKQNGHVLCVHEYGEGIAGTFPFHTGRYNTLYEYLKTKGADCDLYITESGFVEYPGEDMLMERVRFLDDLYAGDDYLKGSALFTLGDWFQANIQAAVPEPLADHIVNFVPDTTPPPEVPPPDSSECAPRLRYKRVYHYIEHTKARPALYADRLAVWMEADKTHGTYGNSLDDALHGPGVDAFCILYGIERDRQMEFKAFRTQYYPAAKPLEFKPIPDGETEPPQSDTIEFIYPVRGVRFVTSPYGQRDPGFHFGVDLRAPTGERVLAAADGVVEFVGLDTALNGGYGLYIRIRHDGYDDKYQTYYAHLLDNADSLMLMPVKGDRVNEGQHIGNANNTGNSRGSHLHWGLKKNSLYVDPMPYLRADQQPEPPPPVVGNAWVGLHLQHHINTGTVQDEIATIATGRIEAVKFNTNANIESGLNPLLAAGVNPSKMVMRLYMAGNSATLKVPADFVDVMAIHLDWLRNVTKDMGGGYVEIHNEPNLTDEGFGFAWNSPQEFHAWLFLVVTELRKRWPILKFGYPGLSPKPEVNAWLDDLLSHGNLLGMLDWIGIHAYWIDAIRMFDPEHGGYYKRYVTRFPDHEKLITEFSHKSVIAPGELSKGEQYVKYYAGLPSEIKAAYSYITADANYPLEEWAGKTIAARVGAR